MKFELKNATDFGWSGLKGRAYSSKEEFADASGAYFEVTGSHGRTKTTHSNRVYLILDGKGEFDVGGETFTVEKTDMIIVPKDKPYDYKATHGTILKMFLVHTPAFDPEKEVSIESTEQQC